MKKCGLVAAIICLVGVATMIFSSLRKKEKDIDQYLLISVLPFVWYILIKNHSYIHARFTYRILLISIFAWLIIVLKNLTGKKKQKNK